MEATDILLPRMEIKQCIAELEGRLKALRAAMMRSPKRMQVYAAYRIPFRGTARVEKDKVIEVIPLSGSEALEAAVNGLTTIRLELGVQSPRETLRVPGLVALPDDWLKEVEQLNLLKDRIGKINASIEDKVLRKEIWSSDKLLSAIQTLRQHWIVEGPERIRLYWDSAPAIKAQPASKWIESLRERLMNYHGFIPTLEQLDDDCSSRKFVYGLNVLEGGGINLRERIAYFRPGQQHVRARVMFLDDDKKAQIRPVSTPIIISTHDSVPTITPLLEYKPKESDARSSRRVRIETEPLVEALDLYRYIEEYRYAY